MTLDIIVPRYREPWDVCHYLFDSIALQRGLSFDNVRVMVVNDGDDTLDEEVFKTYPYRIDYVVKPHGGVSDTRNYGLEHATADYVMFCDIDDGFLNNYGLHLVFSAMQEGYDFICSNFVEETYSADNTMTIVRHDNDYTFMHGKVYKRSFLLEHNIRFDPAMTLHEDGYFNSVVYSVCQHEGKDKKIDTPFYLWRWNDNSTVRKDRVDFVLKTYEKVIQTRFGICEEFTRRGYEEDLETAVVMTVMNSYYDFQKPSYQADKNKRYAKAGEAAFKAFWLKYRKIFLNCTNKKIAEIARVARENAYQNGMLLEAVDLRTWLRHIEA